MAGWSLFNDSLRFAKPVPGICPICSVVHVRPNVLENQPSQ